MTKQLQDHEVTQIRDAVNDVIKCYDKMLCGYKIGDVGNDSIVKPLDESIWHLRAVIKKLL